MRANRHLLSTLALALACAFAGGGACAAQRVPFAVTVNGQVKPDIVGWLANDGVWLSETDALALGLPAQSDGTLDGKRAISLKSMGNRIVFDENEMRLTVTLDASQIANETSLNLRKSSALGDSVVTGNGLLLDYEIGAGRAVNVNTLDATLRTRASFEGVQLIDERTGSTVNGRFLGGSSRTTVRKDWFEQGLRLDVGSLTTPDGGLGNWNEWRGISLASAYFGYNAQLAAATSVGLSALVKYPSTADIYVNGIKQGSYPVAPGALDVQGLRGYAPGATNVRAVIRDIFGNEQVVDETRYVADTALASGVQEFNYQLGRDVFAADRGPQLRAVHRLGVTDELTLSARVETRRGFAAAQLGAVRPVAGAGEFGASVMFGKSVQGEAPRGYSLSHRYQAPAWTMLTTLTSRQAPLFGATRGLITARMRQLATQGAYSIAGVGQLTARASVTQMDGAPKLLEAELGFSKTIGQGVFVQASLRASSAVGPAVQVAMTWKPEVSTVVTSYTEIKSHHLNQQLSYGREAGTDQTGWRVEGHSQDKNLGASGYFDRAVSAGLLRANLAADKQGTAGRLGFRGGLIASSYGVVARSINSDAAIVVDTDGLADVGVLRNGLQVGKTDANGHFWVPNLQGYEEVRITLNENELPVDRWYTGSGVKAIRPAPGSVAPVAFDLRQFRTVDLTVEDCSDGACHLLGNQTVLLESEGGVMVRAGLNEGHARAEGVLTGRHRVRTNDDTCTGQLEVTKTGPAVAKVICRTKPELPQ